MTDIISYVPDGGNVTRVVRHRETEKNQMGHVGGVDAGKDPRFTSPTRRPASPSGLSSRVLPTTEGNPRYWQLGSTENH